MTRPVRIQLSRRKGFRLQEHSRALNGLPAVNVARPSRWGNPFKVGRETELYKFPAILGVTPKTLEHVLISFWSLVSSDNPPEILLKKGGREVKVSYPSKDEIRRHLRGKNLACWCPLDAPCHADILLRIANEEDDGRI